MIMAGLATAIIAATRRYQGLMRIEITAEYRKQLANLEGG
jgi:hypothetical protein